MGVKIDKDRKVVASLFSSIAPVYDTLNRTLSLGRDRIWRRELVRGADLPPNGLVLDLCTGTGDVALTFLTERPEFKGMVYAVDFSALMVDKAREKIAHLGPPYPVRVEFLMGDALDLQFPDDKFDIVSVAFGIRNFANLRQGLEEIHRVLKPGGQANILEFFSDNPAGRVVRWYLDYVVTTIGDAVSRTEAYTYLRRSSSEFISRKGFEETLLRLGFTDLSSKHVTFGVAHIVRARKGKAG
jgi:demethylmenaquinone methyltransferase/2-methoxy-6-polyprenyl-1,4-benzoquinol methylase